VTRVTRCDELLMKIISRYTRVIVLVLLGLLLNGCGETQQTDDEAAALINRYFMALKNSEIETAVAMYPNDVQAQWQLFLIQAEKDRGAVKHYVIQSIEPSTVYSGRYYIATVQVTGRKDDSAFNSSSTEIVTAFHKLSEDQPYIVSHKIKSVH
jgi:hypothetical protein